MEQYFPHIGLVANITGVLFAAISILVAVRALVKRRLECSIVQSNFEITENEAIGEKRHIFPRKIFEPWFVLLKFKNTGNAEILVGDFDGNIEVTCEIPVQILAVDIFSKNPSDLNLQVDLVDSRVVIEPTLLNTTEEFVLKVFLDTNQIPDFKIRARIKGIKPISVSDRNTHSTWIKIRGYLWRFVVFTVPLILFGEVLRMFVGGTIWWTLIIGLMITFLRVANSEMFAKSERLGRK